jgi:hypothetical protein
MRFKKKKQPKETIFLSSRAACPGEEERGTVSFKTTPFRFLFFSFFYMKRRRFKKNAPFHLSPARRQNASICKAALNYLFFLQLHPCQFRSPPLLLAAFFTLVLGL